jgi:hypothetical protein
MGACSHSRCEDSFHVSSYVLLACGYREWTKYSKALATAGVPLFFGDGVEPHLAK